MSGNTSVFVGYCDKGPKGVWQGIQEIHLLPSPPLFSHFLALCRLDGIVCVLFRTRLMKDAPYFSSYKWPFCLCPIPHKRACLQASKLHFLH